MSGVYSTVPNYGGKQPTNTSYIKQFTTSIYPFSPFTVTNVNGLEYVTINNNLLVNQNLTVIGSINGPSDIILKDNVKSLNISSDNFMMLNPVSFTLKSCQEKKTHYGLIAQEVEQLYPELVDNNSMLGFKTVNYLELIPILILQIQKLQNEVDELKKK